MAAKMDKETVLPPQPKPPVVPERITNNDWERDLEASSASTGVDVNLMRKFVRAESNGNPNAQASTSTAAGLFQITQGTWDDLRGRYPQLNLTNRMAPEQQARLAPYYMREIQQNLTRKLGRAPNDAESYLGWFLGPVGGALVAGANPDTPVERVVGAGSMAANPKVFNKVKTVGDLYAWAGGKMGSDGAAPGPKIDLMPYLAKGHDASHLDKMDFDLKSRLANMVSDMPEELRKSFQINSGFRSVERQQELFDAAVIKYGSPEAARKWVAAPGGSQHNHGRAADLNMSGDPAIKTWLHANAAKYGLGFPMAHEPWHIEALNGRDAKYARMGIVPSSTTSTSTRIPFTGADDAAAHAAKEGKAYSLVQAAGAAAGQDWTTSYLLDSQGKQPYDRNYSVTPDALKEGGKGLPPNYLGYLGQATSQQDFDFRVRRSQADHEVETRLANTPYGPGIRMAVALADPAGLALGLLSPVGMAAKMAQMGRAARLGAAAADGVIGGIGAELPIMLNKPGYDMEQMVWAGAIGAGGMVALDRGWAKKAPHIKEEAEAFVGATQRIRDGLEQTGEVPNASAGAMEVHNQNIEHVRGDLEDFLDLKTEKTAMGAVRFDFGKLKNSENPLIAAVADRLGMDTVGNVDKNVAITRPIEHDKRIMEDRANIMWSREYDVAAADYRERNKISGLEWEKGGAEDKFQRDITAAVRNTDPLQNIDPALLKMAKVQQDLFSWWRERAINPGKDRGEVHRPLAGAENWSDDKTYVPRYIKWDKWGELNRELGTRNMELLLSKSIHAQNPDMGKELAYKLGGWYYSRVRNVQAGQEMTASKVFSGLDTEMMRKSLTEELGLSEAEVRTVLYAGTAGDEAGKALTSRQKMRTHMNENFRMTLQGRNGAREVGVSEIWEDNMRSISHAYNSQMSGTIALAQFRIENPNHVPSKVVKDPKTGVEETIEGTPEYLIDGIHSEGDWSELLQKIRAVDDVVRSGDMRVKAEAEIRNLQWMFDSLTGKPSDFSRSKIGQMVRIAQSFNFVRLMSQAGASSIAELGMITGQTGWKHALNAVPHLEDYRRDAISGLLKRDALEDAEYIFAVGTDHLRGTGMTWKSNANLATSDIKPSKLDGIEQGLSKASRYTSMVSLAPITTAQERIAQRAVLSKFRAAANGDEVLKGQRMRIIGLNEADQKNVLAEIKKHSSSVDGENGRKIETLGLDKWDEQTRSTFEFAVSTWVRRIIQQNDLGQMNHVMGHPLAKLMFQFRSFTLGAWSKNTLSSMHLRDTEALNSFWASMMFGGFAYTSQTALNGIGLTGKDRESYMNTRLDNKKIAGAAFQRAGVTSLIPGFADFGLGLLSLDPLFDTRSTNQPTQTLAGSSPTVGILDNLFQGLKGISNGLRGEGYTRKDARTLSRAINPFHAYPGLIQTINATSNLFPEG